MKIWGRALIAMFVMAAGAVACSTDDLVVDDVDVPLGIDDGASEGAEKSARVDGSAEAKLTVAETGASLTVPKGALDREVTITVARPSDEKAVELVKTLKSVKAVASAPYVLTPHGTKFKSAVSLELPVMKHIDRELAVAWLEDESDKEWKVLSDAKVVDGKVRVELKHFSVIVIFDVAMAGLDASVPVDVEDDDAGENVEPPLDAGSAPTTEAGVSDPRGAKDARVGPEPLDGAAPVDEDAGSSSASDASVGRDAGKYDYDGGYYYPDTGSATDAASYDPDAYLPYDDGGYYYDGGYYDPDAYVPYDPDAYVPYEPDAYVPPKYDDAGNPIDAGDEPDAIIT